MNFSSTIKNEIISKPIKERHCKKAFLAGIIRGSGALYETDGRLGIEFSVTGEDTAMTVHRYFEQVFNYPIREVAVSEDRLNKKEKFTLSVSGVETEDILKDLGVLIDVEDETVVNLKLYDGHITEKECCLKSFIKGLFLSAGSCTMPHTTESDKTGYHLEIVFSHSIPAMETSTKLRAYGIESKVLRRKESYITYIKSAEEIKNFIAFINAPVSVLKLTDLMVEREFVNNVNRRKNCDLGNLNRQVEATAKQIDAINHIKNRSGLESLKKDLKETAIARLENPDDTLIELAQKLNVTKSCLNHRLRKLVAVSEELKGR
ncbi:MAG: DNA-binding protein WhiA [Clostridiales bacterium]|nr:DNA-binding protein WhiA [Clostridiales bacterium]